MSWRVALEESTKHVIIMNADICGHKMVGDHRHRAEQTRLGKVPVFVA